MDPRKAKAAAWWGWGLALFPKGEYVNLYGRWHELKLLMMRISNAGCGHQLWKVVTYIFLFPESSDSSSYT